MAPPITQGSSRNYLAYILVNFAKDANITFPPDDTGTTSSDDYIPGNDIPPLALDPPPEKDPPPERGTGQKYPDKGKNTPPTKGR